MGRLIAIIIATAVAAGGGAFYGGMKYAGNKDSRTQSLRAGFQNLSPEEREQRMQERSGTGGARFRQGLGGQEFASGEILSKNDKSITIKLRDGGSKIIFYSEATEIGKFVGGAASDLKAGKTISASGQANADGSITAQSIQIRPDSLNQP